MGAFSTEVCVAEFSARQAGMVAGRTSPNIVMKGCAVDETIGGHHADIVLAEEMKKRFVAKYPKDADDLLNSPKCLRRLLQSAEKTRHQLSAGKQSNFAVESLINEIDFSSPITREEFEALLEDSLWGKLTEPIDLALTKTGFKLEDIHAMEVIGGAWRMPRVQQVLTDYLAGASTKLELGQHLNGEEASVLGAALYGANSSKVIRPPKRVFFSDTPNFK